MNFISYAPGFNLRQDFHKSPSTRLMVSPTQLENSPATLTSSALPFHIRLVSIISLLFLSGLTSNKPLAPMKGSQASASHSSSIFFLLECSAIVTLSENCFPCMILSLVSKSRLSVFVIVASSLIGFVTQSVTLSYVLYFLYVEAFSDSTESRLYTSSSSPDTCSKESERRTSPSTKNMRR